MAALTGQTIAASYLRLMTLSSAALGTNENAKYLNDAADTSSALSLSSTRVGIGTAAPAAQLHIIGNDVTDQVMIENTDSGSSSAPDLVLYHNSASPADSDSSGKLVFKGNNSSGAGLEYSYIHGRMEDVTAGTENGGLEFITMNDGSGLEALTLQGDGKIGMGTTSPSYNLHVHGSRTSGDIVYIENTADGSQCHGLRVKAGIGNDDFTLRATNTDSDELFVVRADGSVGIGTTTPTRRLELYAASGTTSNFVKVNALADTNSSRHLAGGLKSGGTVRYGSVGVMYNASGTGASDETCGYVRMDATNGAAIYLWFDNSNVLRSSAVIGNVGSTTGTDSTGTMSDERLKNISSDAFPYGLSEINQLTPIKYSLKKGDTSNKLGFGAQTTKPIIPECVISTKECPDGYTMDKYTDSDSEVISGERQVGDQKDTQTPNSSETDKLVMGYNQIIPVLVKAVQELSAKVTALENA